MSEEKPPRRPLFQRLFNKFFQQTLKPRAQLMQALEEAEDNLVIDPYSRSVIEGAMQVESLKVRDVMVPRSKMIMIDSESSTTELLQVMVSSYHSRFPIHNQDQDSILGIVLAKDLLSHYAQDGNDEFNYREYLRDALSVPESKPLGVLLREFQQNKSHMAIVVDEYGEIAGLVTLEDVIEQIVGEIEDEHDQEDDETFIKIDEKTIVVEAAYKIEELEKYFGINITLDSEQEIDTVGGMLIFIANKVPKNNQSFTFNNELQLKVVKASDRRIITLEIKKIN